VARARGLGDVLHFFIPEDEQRGARELAAARSGKAALAPRWCLLAAPERPALCALAVDLAAALSAGQGAATLLAPFPRPLGAPRAADVRWEVAESLETGLAPLLHRFEVLPSERAVLLLVPPDRLRELLDHPAARALDGLLVPVDATARGSARALRWLEAAGNGAGRLRIGALLVGAAGPLEAEDCGGELARAARRRLGLEVQLLGNLERDAASFRSLLHGRSIVELDSASRASRSLSDVAARLSRWHAGTGVSAAS
jgi:hypothetical protein